MMLYPSDDGDSIMSPTLAKCTGLYYIVRPDAATMCGRNAAHVVATAMITVTGVCLSLYPVGLYRWSSDTTQFMLQVAVYTNFLFSAYKGYTMVRRSRDIWTCMDATRTGFARAPADRRRGGPVAGHLHECRAASSAFTRWFAGVNYSILFLWSSFPFLLRDAYIDVRNRDGTSSSYHFNPYNMYFFVSSGTYNRWHYTFHLIEWLFGLFFVVFMVLFDTFMVTLCVAITGQLKVIDDAFARLGHANDDDDDDRGYGDNELERKNKYFEELKCIINRYNKVLGKMHDFYDIVRPVILPQLIVASVTIVCLSFIITMNYFNGTLLTSTQSLKFCSFPTFLFQIYYTCLVFGNLNHQKNAMNFAMYSSNWTQMDADFKKLLLLAMKTHHANGFNMKITNKFVVDLELCARVINMCYSIFSVLVKSQLKLRKK